VQDVEAREPRHRPQHHQHEQQCGEIEGRHQPGEIGQRADAIFADGEGHRPERADRRRLHQQGDQLEHRMAGGFEHRHQRLRLVADHGERNAEQDRHEQYLEDIAVRHRRHHGRGDDVHQKAGQAAFMRLVRIVRHLARIQRGRIDVEPRAGLDHISDDQADDQRQRRKGQEIGEGLRRHPADRAQFLHARNAGDDGQEDDWRDDHLHQLDESLAQRLELLARIGPEMPDQDAQRDRDQHLDVELTIEG
jgi:hypothetical protein